MPPYEVIAFPVHRHENEGAELLPRTANELAVSMTNYLNSVEKRGGQLIVQSVVEVRHESTLMTEAEIEANVEAHPHIYLTSYIPEQQTPNGE